MNLDLLSSTFTALGEITVAYTVISVHHLVMKERQIDDRVFKTMRKEQLIALIGVLFILTGYLIGVYINFA